MSATLSTAPATDVDAELTEVWYTRCPVPTA